jgi:serine O-acetyltransferase
MAEDRGGDRLNPQERLSRRVSHPLVGRFAFLGLFLLGVELPPSVRFGRGLRLAHGAVGLVVHESTVIGDDVRIYAGVTIGRGDQYVPQAIARARGGGGVTIGDRVILGANSVVLFKSGRRITIGDDAVIGAGSVVLDSVPAGEIWAGAPAKRISRNPYARSIAAGPTTEPGSDDVAYS